MFFGFGIMSTKEENKIKQLSKSLKLKRYDTVNSHLLTAMQDGYSSFAALMSELWQIDAEALSEYASHSKTQDFFKEKAQLNSERILMVLHNYSGKSKG